MQININIPDETMQPILDGVCAATGFDAGGNKSQADWLKDKTVAWIKDTAKRGLLKQAQTTTAATVDAVAIS